MSPLLPGTFREQVTLIGTSALGAVVVLGGGLWLLEQASRRNALKIRVETSLDPADRALLTELVRDTRIVASELSASVDRITAQGIDVRVGLGARRPPPRL